MLNNFKRIFGNEKEVIVYFGHYEEKHHMKFKEATKGMRTLFRKAGFQTYLVVEFRTRCMCSKCEIALSFPMEFFLLNIIYIHIIYINALTTWWFSIKK
jgi:hypothetical protein